MRRYGAWAVSVIVLAAGNWGCYYDQWQAEQRANRVLQEKLSAAEDDLQDCQLMNSQKDTEIASLNDRIATQLRTINSLDAELKHLQEAFKKAQDILEKQAARAPDVQIMRGPKLPEPLHNELKALAEAHPDVIEYDERKGAVRWKSDLLFPSGSDKIQSAGESAEALRQFADIVMSDAASGFDVIVVGHTDNVPVEKPETLAEHKDNWYLSVHRAISVMKLLVSDGVSTGRLGVMGYGEYRPIADNSTEAGRSKNRRVEIYLVSKDAVQTVAS